MRKVMRRSLSSAPSFSFPDTPRLFTRCTLSATPTNAPYILLATGRFLVFFVHTREIVPENGILSYSEAVFTAMNLPNFSVKVDISYDFLLTTAQPPVDYLLLKCFEFSGESVHLLHE